jgi:hypothetical protein
MEKVMLPDIHRRIVNAKYIFERASSVQAEYNEISQSISLLLMHDAIELLMLSILDHLNVIAPKKREFMEFWSIMKQANYPDPPDKIAMESLNTMRVALKHKGVLPNPKEVRELLSRARGFFENVLKSYCNLSYADVSLIDLVPDQNVRAILTEARRKFLDQDKDNAMIDLQVAFHKIQQPEGKTLPRLEVPRQPNWPSELRIAGWEAYLSNLHSFLLESASVTNALMFGIDPVRYATFKQTGPNLQWSVAGTYTAMLFRSYQDITLEAFEDFVWFLIDYALKVSEAYIPTVVRTWARVPVAI